MFQFIRLFKLRKREAPPIHKGIRIAAVSGLVGGLLFGLSAMSGMLRASNPGNPAGVVAGDLSVGANGKLNYELALELPPGMRGLTPDISLAYNSGSRTGGILGVGWVLNGLSVIHRCGKSLQLDGEIGPVEFNNNDRLCVDGQRLISSVGATDVQYWNGTARYHSYEESWTRYTPVAGGYNHGPASFTAQTRDGKTLTYGHVSDLPGGNKGAGRFFLTRIEDRNGNQIHISYLGAGGTQHPDEITYNGHKIKFQYIPTGDANIQYYHTTAGANQAATVDQTMLRRLKSIEISANGTAYKHYLLDYGTAPSRTSKRALLREIKECSDAAGANCLEPIDLVWTDYDWYGSGHTNSQARFKRRRPGVNPTGIDPNSGDEYQDELRGIYGADKNGALIYNGDFDGDGRTDFIALQTGAHANDGNLRNFCVYFADDTTKTLGSFDDRCFTNSYSHNNGSANYHHAFRGRDSGGRGVNLIPGDFNGDGLTDFLRQEVGPWAENNTDNTFNVFLATGNRAAPFAVHNPDTNSEQTWLKGAHGSQKNGVNLIAGDFNGDGRTDFIAQQHGDWSETDNCDNSGWGCFGPNFSVYIASADGTTFTQENSHVWAAATGKGLAGKGDNTSDGVRIIPGDFNADGMTDFIAQQYGGWSSSGDDNFQVYISTGGEGSDEFSRVQYASAHSFNQDLGGDEVALIIGDYNGDGRDDFLRQEQNDYSARVLEAFYSRGDGDFNVEDLTALSPDHTDFYGTHKGLRGTDNYEQRGGVRLIPGDFNGDGKTDFIRQAVGLWARDDQWDTGRVFEVYLATDLDTFERITPPENIYQDELRGLYIQLEKYSANIIVGDYDGDGQLDFIKQQGGFDAEENCKDNFVVYLNPFNRHEYSQPSESIRRISQAKLNHDISYDLMTELNPTGGPVFEYPNNPNQTKFKATPMVPTWLVTRIAQDPHDAGLENRVDDYTYGEAVSGAQGGFLGFRFIDVTNEQKELRSLSQFGFYWSDNYRTARLTRSVVYNLKDPAVDTDDIILSYITRDFGNVEKGYLKNSGYSTYMLTQDKITEWDLAHTNGSLSWGKIIEIAHDSFMNPLRVKKKYFGISNLSDVESCTNYSVSTQSAWVLDEVLDKTTASSCTVTGDYCSCSGTIHERVAYDRDSSGNLEFEKKYYTSSNFLTTAYSNYTSSGLPETIEGPDGLQQHIKYDANGHKEKLTEGTHVTNFVYDAKWGLESSRTDPNGRTFTHTYDAFGRPDTASAPDDSGSAVVRNKVSFLWDGDNLVQKTEQYTDWSGDRVRVQKVHTDAYGNVRKKELSAKNNSALGTIITEYDYNHRDQQIRVSQPRFSTDTRRDTEYTYGGNYLRLTDINRPVGADSSVSYSHSSGILSITETRASSTYGDRIFVMDKDFAGNTTRKEFQATEGNKELKWYYDELGRVFETFDGVSATNIQYDMLGRKTLVKSDQRGREIYTYDNNSTWGGRLRYVDYYNTSFEHTGRKEFSNLDPLKRPRRISRQVRDPNNSGALLSQRRVDLTYDNTGDCSAYTNAKGRLCSTKVSRKIGAGAFVDLLTRVYDYDHRGNIDMLKTTLHEKSKTYTVGYQYERNEGLSRVTYPSGRQVDYISDHMGRLLTAATGGTVYTANSNFTATERPQDITRGNGATETRVYDDFHRVESVTIAGNGTTHLDQDLSYTDFGEIDEIIDANGPDFEFEYNQWGFLTQAVSSASYGTLNYEYYADGSLKKKDGNTYSYASNTHQLVSHTGGLTNVTYNGTGSVISKTRNGQVSTYEYNYNQQMLKASQGGSVVAEFEYDANETRWMKKDANNDIHYYITPELDLQYIDSSDTWVHTEYINGAEGRIAAITENGDGLSLLQNYTEHRMLANAHGLHSFAGVSGYFYHTAAMMLLHPDLPRAANALLFVLALLALLAFAWSYLRSAQVRSGLGRLRAGLAFRLADVGCLSPAQAYAFSRVHGSAFMRRKRFLSLAMPLALIGMLNLQCSSNEQELNGVYPGGAAGGLLAMSSTAGHPVPTRTRYYHSNQVGNVRLVTRGSNGSASAKPVYKPFGALHTAGGINDFRYKFQGKELDNATNLHYFEARYYDADLGRFMQADSRIIGGNVPHASNMDRYAAFGNNPISFSDPSGNSALAVGLIIWGIATIVSFSVAAISATIYAKQNGGRVNWRKLMIEEAIGAAISVAFVGISAGLGSVASRALAGQLIKRGVAEATRQSVMKTAGYIGGLVASYAEASVSGTFARMATADEPWTAKEVLQGAGRGVFFGVLVGNASYPIKKSLGKRGIFLDAEHTVTDGAQGRLATISDVVNTGRINPREASFLVARAIRDEPNAARMFRLGNAAAANAASDSRAVNRVLQIGRQGKSVNWRGLRNAETFNLLKGILVTGPFGENVQYGNHFEDNRRIDP